MSGLSGARVIVFENIAMKTNKRAPKRVIEQGEWLREYEASNLPEVHAVISTGYIMEALTPIPTDRVNLALLVNALDTGVWKFPARNFVDTPETLLKVSGILEQYAPSLIREAIMLLSYIRPTQECLTHGDPTAENVMLRDGEYVVIDPIPSTLAIPDDIAVDVGKLLQSAHGWEAMKGETRVMWTPHEVEDFFIGTIFDVAQLWCIVHFVRTLPYVSKEVRPRVVDKLAELLGV